MLILISYRSKISSIIIIHHNTNIPQIIRFCVLRSVADIPLDIKNSNKFHEIDASNNEQIIHEDSETGSDDSAILQGILEQQVAAKKVQAYVFLFLYITLTETR